MKEEEASFSHPTPKFLCKYLRSSKKPLRVGGERRRGGDGGMDET